MIKKLIKNYSFILFAGSIYYAVLFMFQYDNIYRSWKSWSHPVYDSSTYGMLAFFYVVAMATPIIMLLSGALLYKFGYIKWYLVVPLVVLLAMSGLIGKLILVAGVCTYMYKRFFYTSHT